MLYYKEQSMEQEENICACFLPVPLIAPCNITYIYSDLHFDILLFFIVLMRVMKSWDTAKLYQYTIFTLPSKGTDFFTTWRIFVSSVGRRSNCVVSEGENSILVQLSCIPGCHNTH